MTRNWVERSLYELADYQNGRAFRPRETRAVAGLPVVKIAELNRGITEETGRYSSDLDARHRIEEGDLIFSWSGTILIKRWPGPPAALNQHLFKVSPKEGVEAAFLEYLLKSQQSRFEALVADQRTTMGHIKVSDLKRLFVVLPPLKEQRAIADQLRTLDDKIYVNQRMNQTLEAIARAIFKSWFVDFDPVRAKMDGRQPIVPDELIDRFPDRMVDSPIGRVPEGWEVAPLTEHVEAVRGLSYRGADLTDDEGLPLHNLNSVLEGGGYKYDGIKHYAGKYKDRHLVRHGDVIVANTDLTHRGRVIGSPAIVPGLFGDEGLFSHHLYRVRPLSGSPVTPRFLYLLILSHRLREEIIGYTHGTTVNMLSIDGLQRPRFVVPPPALAAAFDGLVLPIFKLAERNVRESWTLSEARDWLLPRLVSGRVRVG